MQDLGVLLQETREGKKITLEQAARETNTVKSYLDALETGRYNIFPGEPYVIGFLRNYAEYLGLDDNHCVSLYRAMKIQEQSVPPENLIPPHRFSIPKSIIFTVAGLVLIAGIAFVANMFIGNNTVGIAQGISKIEKSDTKKIEPAHSVGILPTQKRYTVKEELFEKRLFAGDILAFQVGGKTYELTVKKTTPDFYLDTPLGTQIIALGQSLILDLNGDITGDVKVLVKDFDKSDASKGVLVEVLTGNFEAPPPNEATDIHKTQEGIVSGSSTHKTLFDAGSAYPVTLNVTFRGYCLFRYEKDHAKREERYYQKSEQLTVQANNGMRIWASNGNAAKMQIIAGGKTIDIEVSKPGEVIVKDLKWVKSSETNRYSFMVINVD